MICNTPSINTFILDDLPQNIKAMVMSLDPCGSPGSCSCSVSCNFL